MNFKYSLTINFHYTRILQFVYLCNSYFFLISVAKYLIRINYGKKSLRGTAYHIRRGLVVEVALDHKGQNMMLVLIWLDWEALNKKEVGLGYD